MTQVPLSFSPKPVASAAGEGAPPASAGAPAATSGGFATAWRQHSAPAQPQPSTKTGAAASGEILTATLPVGEQAVLPGIAEHLGQEALDLGTGGELGSVTPPASVPLPPLTIAAAPLPTMPQAEMDAEVLIALDQPALDGAVTAMLAPPLTTYPPLADASKLNVLHEGDQLMAPGASPASTLAAMVASNGPSAVAPAGGDGLQSVLLDATAEQLDSLAQLKPDELATAATPLRAAREALAAPLGLPPGVKVSYPAELPVGHQDWAEHMAERGVALLARGLNSAEIRLDPPELGAMQIRIHVRDDVATVQFVSPHAHVREALDQTAARLREMLSEQGFREVQTDISDGRGHARREGQGEQPTAGAGGNASGGDSVADQTDSTHSAPRQGVLGVDQFV